MEIKNIKDFVLTPEQRIELMEAKVKRVEAHVKALAEQAKILKEARTR